MAVPKPAPRKPAPAAEHVALLDLNSYGGGNFDAPEGWYAIYHDVRVHSYTKQDGKQGTPMLGVMLTMYPLDGGPAVEHFCGLGSKAMASFAPDPDSADENGAMKKLAKIPGAPAASLGGLSGFNLYFKSILDCCGGLPDGVDTNDLTTIDGVWAHIVNIPEPEERKAFARSTTSDIAGQQQNRGPKKVAVVDELKDDGKPWEGGGGAFDGMGEEVATKPAPKAAPKPAAKPAAPAKAAAPKPGPKPVAKPAPVEEEATEGADEDLTELAQNVFAGVLEKNPKGCTLSVLRMGAFKAAGKVSEEMAQRIVDEVLDVDETRDAILEQLGWKVEGTKVVSA